MPLAKVGVSHTPQAFVLSGVHCLGTLGPVSPSGGAVTTAIQASLPIGVTCKIYKVQVSCTALSDLLGTFNVVVNSGSQLNGSQSYTPSATSLPANDNSYTHDAANPVGVDALGYPTNVVGTTAPSGAVTANKAFPVTLFSADQALNAANGFSTTGGTATFLPPNYDAVIPVGAVLTLRTFLTVTTGSATNLVVSVWGEVMGLRAGPVASSTYYSASPGVDF